MPASARIPLSLPPRLLQQANKLDSEDDLRKFRDQFSLPPSYIYLCGNSLGAQPKRSAQGIQRHLQKWALLGVEGHFEHPEPWATIEEEACTLSMDIVGAKFNDEIAIMNTLTVNLHLMLTSFYRPCGKRTKILIEGHAFSSDEYAIQSHISSRGLDANTNIVRLSPRDGEEILRYEDIIDEIRRLDEEGSLALVLFPGVQFYTGQVFPMENITKECNRRGIGIGFDLAHAVGNVPLYLHDWNVDFAVWCSYKYLNSGPGSIAGMFLHHKYQHNTMPKLVGWWGHTLHTRFQMPQQFIGQSGARGYQLSNPSVFATIPLVESLRVFRDAGGVVATRRKSLKLTRFLRESLHEYIGEENGMEILTPEGEEESGSQLSIRLDGLNSEEVNERLKDEFGIICDVRKPNVIRVAGNALYNSFHEAAVFVCALLSIVSTTRVDMT